MTVTNLSPTQETRLPEHHIPAELLLDYASGNLAESWSLVVACHLTLCPHCRRELAMVERAAGSMLEAAPAEAVSTTGFAAIADRLGEQETVESRAKVMRMGDMPSPLKSYLEAEFDGLPWRWSGAGLQSYALPLAKTNGGMVSLLKIAPGAGLPMHTHRGEELTLVLNGGFTDETGSFRKGDLEVADGGVEHRPIAMLDQPCICLVVTSAPLNFRGPLGWFFNQWAKRSA